MNIGFTKENIDEISRIFNSVPEEIQGCYNWMLVSPEKAPKIAVSLYTNINGGENILLSVQTALGCYELHNVKKWTAFSTQEIIFWTEENDKISAISIGCNHEVSFYANISKSILDEDITKIEPELLLSVMQLSLLIK